MSEWLLIVVLTLGAGLSMPLGALLARIEHLHPQWLEQELRHSIIAFGGGALLSAIALVLIPEGSAKLSITETAIYFALGGLAFMALDRLLDYLKSPASQLAAMLSDFIPEALALGAAFAEGGSAGILLAGLIALQNLPEGFNAFREMNAAKAFKPSVIILAFLAMAFLGPIAGLAGYFWLAAFPNAVGAIMVFAAGGILYLTFQDIAPQAKLEKHWGPPMGAVAGFLLGLIGQLLIH
ncbi:ZIP family metal transporter [Kangiella geojedonensis]|uniref:ZIP zinc transporter family protein n=1 Tax=Kangiella geojedonensis TaxID=914150 RepID=A0A0F6TPE7_9GAMM|nr:divalent cation transporter [Kangiella geojedonensis]AKE51424.1 ZIP zinc transporter family protein [Kangiella geojedonensis]